MFQFGGLGALFGGLNPPKPPVATGLGTSLPCSGWVCAVIKR